MRIDLHTHTQNLKSGDGNARVISPTDYAKKMSEQNIEISSITNHNKFDKEEYDAVIATNPDLLLFPGIELDIDLGEEKRQIIVICNPAISGTFKTTYDNDTGRNYNTFSMPYADFLAKTKSLSPDSVIIIPHFLDKARGLNFQEKQSLERDLDGYVIILETANLTSMGIVNDHEERLCLIGSDAKDWSQYSSDMVPELKFSISSFERFYELAKNPKEFVKNFLEGSPKHEIELEDSSASLTIFNDINVVFGEKGSGKTILLKSTLHPYFSGVGKKVFLHEGSEYKKLYNSMITEYEDAVAIDQELMATIVSELENVIGYREAHLKNSIQSYIDYAKDTNVNKKAKRVLKSNSVFSDTNTDTIEDVLKSAEQFIAKIREVEKINAAIRKTDTEDKMALEIELRKLEIEIVQRTTAKSKDLFTAQKTEAFLSVLKESLQKNSGKKSKPENIGFAKLVASRLAHLNSNRALLKALDDIQSTQSKKIGHLPGKGQVVFETSVIRLTEDDRHGKDSAFDKSRIVANRTIIKKIGKFTPKLFTNINSYYSNIEKAVNTEVLAKDIVKKNSIIKIMENDNYKPSEGEQAILSISGLLESYNYDCYIFDEIERGLGHKYITDYLIPRLKTLRDAGKTIILSTHDANIAINTLPSQTVFCNYPDQNNYYTGNMYSNELVGATDEAVIAWSDQAIVHLEGGEKMFNSRRNVYA